MKLHDFKQINEGGFVEPNLLLSIDNIIRRGRADNHFEFLVMARCLQLLKLGEFYKNSNPLFDGHISTSKAILDHLRALPPAEQTAIAIKLRGVLEIKDKDQLYALANPAQETIEWLKLYASREAND